MRPHLRSAMAAAGRETEPPFIEVEAIENGFLLSYSDVEKRKFPSLPRMPFPEETGEGWKREEEEADPVVHDVIVRRRVYCVDVGALCRGIEKACEAKARFDAVRGPDFMGEAP